MTKHMTIPMVTFRDEHCTVRKHKQGIIVNGSFCGMSVKDEWIAYSFVWHTIEDLRILFYIFPLFCTTVEYFHGLVEEWSIVGERHENVPQIHVRGANGH